jgi:hypothetical protein
MAAAKVDSGARPIDIAAVLEITRAAVHQAIQRGRGR